jgi:response regulator RpfG family c-di-GMP phosphodiesterase
MSSPPPPSRTLLLVDDEPNILNSLQRLFRREGYRILVSDDPIRALDILTNEEVDVILSDQRMPDMTGVEFLRRAKETHPDTIRIVLSGYTDLQFITDAINEGAIYKFLTKPWDDAQLREQIRDAFHNKAIADENRRLTQELREANVALQAHVAEREHQAKQLEAAIDTLQEVLQLIPFPLLGIDEAGMVALANAAADGGFGAGIPLLGQEASVALPREVRDWLDSPANAEVLIQGRRYRVIRQAMGRHSRSRGTLLALFPL